VATYDKAPGAARVSAARALMEHAGKPWEMSRAEFREYCEELMGLPCRPTMRLTRNIGNGSLQALASPLAGTIRSERSNLFLCQFLTLFGRDELVLLLGKYGLSTD
jgi:hypothetical protein